MWFCKLLVIILDGTDTLYRLIHQKEFMKKTSSERCSLIKEFVAFSRAFQKIMKGKCNDILHLSLFIHFFVFIRL